MFSTKRVVNTLTNVIEDLHYKRIPTLQRSLTQLNQSYEKLKEVYSLAQLGANFKERALHLLKIRSIKIDLEWDKSDKDRPDIPTILIKANKLINEMILDKNFIEYEKNKKLSSLSSKSKLLIEKYGNTSIEAKLLFDMDLMQTIFTDMLEEFNDSYLKLGVNEFIEEAESTNKPLINELHIIIHKLADQLSDDDMDDDQLSIYIEKRQQLTEAQAELNQDLESKRQYLAVEKFEFQSSFKGDYISERFDKDRIRLSELRHLSDEIAKQADKVESSPKYRYLSMNSAKNKLARQKLQHLQSKVLCDENLIKKWSHVVKTLNFGCFFVGGTRVTLSDDTTVIVPTGIAALYNKLRDKDLKSYSSPQIEVLYDDIKACVERKLNGRSCFRHRETTQLYRSLMRLEEVTVNCPDLTDKDSELSIRR